MKHFVLAIDQGTTGTTCLILHIAANQIGRIVGRGYCELRQHFPQPGWVEHDLHDIWQSVRHAFVAALQTSRINPADLAAIGITNQRETTGLWMSSGMPIHHAIVWQDRRTAQMCEALKQLGYEDIVRKRTGLVIDPYFSASKIAWLLQHIPGAGAQAKAGLLRFGTVDTWLIWQLSSGASHVTDATNASRTMLFDIANNHWDESLCEMLGAIPTSLLPQVHPSSGVIAHTQGLDFLPDGIPIAGVAGDQHAALFGQCCFQKGMAKCTYGTGAFVLMNTGADMQASKHGLLTTIAWRLGDTTTYALEGSVFMAGALIQWLRDGLGIIAHSRDVEALAAEVANADGVVLVPAFTGLGAPHWRPEARGMLSGLTRGTTKAHIARAALDSIAYQVYDLLHAMQRDAHCDLALLRVDGGAAVNNLLMQYQADILGIPVHRPHVVETTALGAAYLAALGVGLLDSIDEVTTTWLPEREFTPTTTPASVQHALAQWWRAIDKV